MIDMRKQFGATLDAKGLVMRAEDHGSSMTFYFAKASDESWRSTVRLIVDGSSSTGRGEATWEDVTLIAAEVKVEKIGEDWTVYNTSNDYIESHEGSDADFIYMINAHFVELETVPWTTELLPGILSDNATCAFNALTTMPQAYGWQGYEIKYERDSVQETLSSIDGEGKVFKFECPFEREPIFYVDDVLVCDEWGETRNDMVLEVDEHYVPPAGFDEDYLLLNRRET
jgi:hypothetical protein